MKPEIKQLWVEALKGGKYKQAKGRLHMGRGGFCCLGVLCDVYRQKTGNGEWVKRNGDYYFESECNVLPTAVCEWAGLSREIVNPIIGPELKDAAAALNDCGMSFTGIADLIQQHL
jgi:hypothetical protein